MHEFERPAIPGRGEKPKPGCAIGCLGLVVLTILVMGIVRPYADYLWYVHDARRPEVFTIPLATRGMLFAVAFVIAVAIFAVNLGRALSVGMVYLRTPESFGEVMVANAIGWIQRHAAGGVKIAAVVLGFFFASTFSGEWNTYLVWRHGGEFGVKDPLFGRDVGFFVFDLPWLLACLQFLATLFLLTSLATLGIYVGMQALGRLAKIELSRPAVRGHLSVLFAATLLVFALVTWFRTFEYGIVESAQFTGAGFAAVQKLGAQRILAVLVGLAGVVTLLGMRSGPAFRGTLSSLAVAALWWMGAMVVYPSIVQRFKVEPNKLTVERPFARNAIKMTRWAFGLDAMEVRSNEVSEQPSAEEIADAKPTLDSMRLWDPEILRRTIEVQQGLRPYYTFRDVDVDRYTLGGKVTPVMLAPRDVRLDGLNPSARTWINERLQYTHGFGAVMMAVNGADANGRPLFLIKDFPPKTPPEIPLNQPRLYFSDFRDDAGAPDDPYALVGTRMDEFDYPIGDQEKTYRWTGGRGVPLPGLFSKLVFSLVLSDGNLLVSPNISGETRLLYRRNVTLRARAMFPFLRYDSDPYIVIERGRIIWILDAYTATDNVPYSGMVGTGRDGRLNYIRNSVKVTVDAYSGECHAYAMLPEEPILKAYSRIYPGLIEPIDKMPPELVRHWRYPEDLFKLQAYQLTQYHVTDSTIFLNNSDAWEMPVEQGPTGAPTLLDPYYVQIQLPGSKKPNFMLILPMTPRAKPNMSGWLAAHCDPELYGKTILFKYPTGSNMPGPAQMEAKISQDPEIANINKLWNTDYSTLISGNLLVVPIGTSVLYVKPLFLQSKTNPIPEMRKVILAISNGEPVVADNYEDALATLFGKQAPQVAPPAGQEPPPEATLPKGSDLLTKVREASRLLDEADKALRAGDFARYGELQRRARSLLKEIAR